MFKKLVAVESLGMDKAGTERLKSLCGEYISYSDTAPTNEELIRRIGDADGALVSYTGKIDGEVIDACPNLRYIGMACSLYDEKSANVDIARAREKNIVVTGVRDYGDNGVIEFGISELVRLLHGFGNQLWRERPTELSGVKIGILGMGTTGILMADALQFFGADVYYYSRTRKPEQEAKGRKYLPLDELLQTVDILSAHLNKNTILLHEREFSLFGNGKILLNTAIGACFDMPALKNWLANGNNYYICDDVASGNDADVLGAMENVIAAKRSAGSSVQCTQRLSQKTVDNIENYFAEIGENK